MASKPQRGTYLWCDHCRRSFDHHDAPDGMCPICGESMQSIGKINAILRGLMANDLSPTPLFSKHKQMIRIIWTSNGMGEQYYRVLAPNMSYSKFEGAMTELLCRGARDGWVEFLLPSAPVNDESQYSMKIIDEDRFLAAMQSLAGPEASLE